MRRWSGLCILAVCACASSNAPSVRPVEPPATSADTFPTLPFEPSAAFETLYRAVREPSRLRPPRGDTGVWARNVYQPWMAARTETIALAMDIRRSSRLHAVVPPVAAGLHAALLADTARQLYDLDLPDPLAEAVQEPVVGLRARATRAYEVCYELALSAGPALDGWHRFCGAGLADLAERDALDRAQSTTREPPPAPAP